MRSLVCGAALVCLLGIAWGATPKPLALGKLNTHFHSVSGCVCVLDAQTICLKNFNYDGLGPDAYFWTGSSTRPDHTGYIIPNEKSESTPLKAYRNKDLTLRLPAGKSLKDSKWFSVWCRKFKANFADLIIPANSITDDKLKNARGASCSSCSCN